MPNALAQGLALAPNVVEVSPRLVTSGQPSAEAAWRRLMEEQLRKHKIAFELF
jgi:hypothetical protein